MAALSAIVFVIVFTLFLLGMKKPSMFSGFFDQPVEPKILKIFGSLSLVFFLLTVIGIRLDDFWHGNENTPKTITQVYEDEGISEEDANSDIESAIVTGIVDGDTIIISGDRHLRLLAIDTPEKGEACYSEAGRYLGDLVLGKNVELISDERKIDKYGRLLRFVLLGGENINLKMVEAGLAKCYSFAEDTLYVEDCARAEREARDAGLGCIYREHEASIAPETSQASGTCLIKGNISYGSGERIYHTPDCENYEETIVDPENGERWFCTEEEAIAAGWEKAKNCP